MKINNGFGNKSSKRMRKENIFLTDPAKGGTKYIFSGFFGFMVVLMEEKRKEWEYDLSGSGG